MIHQYLIISIFVLISCLNHVIYQTEGKEIKRSHHSFRLREQEQKMLEATLEAWKQQSQLSKVNRTVHLLPNEAFHPKKNSVLLNKDANNVPVQSKGGSGKRAVVTLLCGGIEELNIRYTRYLHAFAYTLRSSRYTGEILVLYTPDFPIGNARKTMEKFQIVSKQVQTITIPDISHKYSKMLTKLHLWNLLEYDQLMYYDVDFIFQGNPMKAFDDCGQTTPLCAVLDQGIRQMKNYENKRSYFNAGFLILKPDVSIYQQLLSQQSDAYGAFFVEQDLLNNYFQFKWKMLDIRYNLMHSYKLQQIDSDVIAIHEKLHELKKTFPGRQYVWNQLR